MREAIHAHMEGRLSDAEFDATSEDATRLAVEAQLRAGVDVVTDGEQRRDNYASFVGGRLDNCQLIPLTDLLPLPRCAIPPCSGASAGAGPWRFTSSPSRARSPTGP